MDDKMLIKELQNAYNITGNNKIRFIRTIKKPSTSIFSFIINQSKLISLKVYLCCLIYFIVLLILLFSLTNTRQYIVLAAGIPFLSLILISIIDTSRVYAMEELEMATLYSLKMVVLARMLIMSIIACSLIIIIALFTSLMNNKPFIQIISYFFIPYFLNTYLSLVILKKFRNNGVKYCLVLSSIICLLILYLIDNPMSISVNPYCCIGCLMVIMTLVTIESRNYIKGLEDYVWNL